MKPVSQCAIEIIHTIDKLVKPDSLHFGMTLVYRIHDSFTLVTYILSLMQELTALVALDSC